MKRINKIFTMLNILLIFAMLFHIGYAYSHADFHEPPEIVFYLAFIYMLPLTIINGIWLLIRTVRFGERARVSKRSVSDESEMLRSDRVNFIFILLNILFAAAIAVHTVIAALSAGGSYVLSFIGVVLYYGVPIVLINDAWLVIHMNMKKTN